MVLDKSPGDGPSFHIDFQGPVEALFRGFWAVGLGFQGFLVLGFWPSITFRELFSLSFRPLSSTAFPARSCLKTGQGLHGGWEATQSVLKKGLGLTGLRLMYGAGCL